MSGGSFNYAYSRVDQFADDLATRLDEPGRKNKYGETPNSFEPETLAKLREIEALARYTAKLMREAEWLYSGDTSDGSFMDRVNDINRERTITMEWQPIKTAPKDGSVVLVNDTTSDTPWVAAKFICGDEWQGWIYDDDLTLDSNPTGPEPTLWFPLPTLPKAPNASLTDAESVRVEGTVMQQEVGK